MKFINGYIVRKKLFCLILFCAWIVPTVAFSASPVDSEDMVMVPGGPFLMGVDKVTNVDVEKMSKRKKLRYLVSRAAFHDEGPAHNIIVDTFMLDTFEVSNKKYSEFIKATGHPAPAYWDDHKRNKPKQPVSGVNWFDANAYCGWANKRLPTEAEWEKAARGTDRRKYPWGGASPTCDLISMGCSGQTLPVGSFEGSASAYGLMDMAGNVWEWTADWYFGNYYFSMPEGVWMNPLGPETGSRRVRRGGSWQDDMYYYRTSARSSSNPSFSSNNQGFRCAQ